MPDPVIMWKCAICGSPHATKDAALECEKRGLPPAFPKGLVFLDEHHPNRWCVIYDESSASGHKVMIAYRFIEWDASAKAWAYHSRQYGTRIVSPEEPLCPGAELANWGNDDMKAAAAFARRLGLTPTFWSHGAVRAENGGFLVHTRAKGSSVP